MRKIILLASFSLLTPFILAISFLFLFYISSEKNSPFLSFGKTPKVAYAAIPSKNQAITIKINGVDARVSAVKNFFSYYKSVLTPYADEVVAAADRYGLDYRLIPAIAMQESTLCKKIPKDSYNCWGFGIYGKKITRFDNYKQAINTVTKARVSQYKVAGLESPEEIMSKYNPVSKGTWAAGVSNYMDKLRVDL